MDHLAERRGPLVGHETPSAERGAARCRMCDDHRRGRPGRTARPAPGPGEASRPATSVAGRPRTSLTQAVERSAVCAHKPPGAGSCVSAAPAPGHQSGGATIAEASDPIGGGGFRSVPSVSCCSNDDCVRASATARSRWPSGAGSVLRSPRAGATGWATASWPRSRRWRSSRLAPTSPTRRPGRRGTRTAPPSCPTSTRGGRTRSTAWPSTADLAPEVGQDLARFKLNVRKLKSLGLTISLETGYRLSPRGEYYLSTR